MGTRLGKENARPHLGGYADGGRATGVGGQGVQGVTS
jgi:hypothetical protein